MDNGKLILSAQSLARGISYNEERDAPIKHTLHELCHRLGSLTVKVAMRKGKLTVITTMGQSRTMTFTERCLYKWFGVVPPIKGYRGDK